jgi:DeoR/GlpR family transcriptional regulator of sugar metabolism
LARLTPAVSVYCCGGMLRPVAYTFVGPQAEEYFRTVNAATCFLSATGLTLAEGITDVSLLEIQVKRVMAASADRVIFLLDSSKFGVRSLARIVPLRKSGCVDH